MTPIEKAIFAVGSQAKLSRAVGVSPQAIWNMKARGGKITTRNVPAKVWSSATGVPLSELFPEKFS